MSASFFMQRLGKDDSGRITVAFPYDPLLVEKVKTIEGRKWHKDDKYWSFPNTDGTLEKILKVFEGEEIQIDPALQAELSSTKIHIPVIARDEVLKQSQIEHPSPIVVSEYNFEDLRRELVSA